MLFSLTEMTLNLFVFLIVLLHTVKLLFNDFPHSSSNFSTSHQYFSVQVRSFCQNMNYAKHDAKTTTTAIRSFLDYHPVRDMMFSPPYTTPENYKDILERLDEIDENTYENVFLFYADVY